MITRFEYDRAGRKRAEIAADGARDSTYYDPAGNVETAVTRRGYRITMTYDALNRLRTRSVPGTITAPRFASSIGHGGVFNFPTRGTDASGNATVAGSSASVTLSGETQRFEYDIAGNLVYAANRDAIVRRRYNHNGTLAGDTLIIATYATRDTTQHVYGLRYQYDVMGRRTDLHHPAVLAPEGGWTVHNEYDPVTGALVAVSDPIGTHQFHFNTAGQLAGETFANGAAETYTHDAEGRLHTRTLTIPSMGVLDADTMTYDMRGKLRVVRQRIGSVQNFYSGLGSLAWSRSTPDNYNYTEQGYIQDALGNTAIAQKFDFQNRDHPKVELTRQTYDTLGTGRLLRVRGYPGWGSDPTSGGNMEYDVGGNNTFASDSRVYDAIANSRRVEAKASYYDAADRLRIVDMQACAWTDIQKAQGMKGTGDGANLTCTHLRAGDRSAFEEYRYDALGRRVLVRTLEGCLDSCIETVTRTVWDGDRLLWEIRAPGAHRERDVVPEGQLPPYNITTGRVAYTFGAALDHPLAVHRFDYRDSIFQRYDTVPVPLINQPLTIYPHTNWRGDYQIGTYITGETSRCAWVLTQQEDEDKYEPIEEPGWDGPPPANGGGQGHRHCLAPVPWPGKYIWLDHSVRAAPPGNPDLWVGSLVKNKRDLTGNLYMRNRYYDARAGRFSQEDPIGLAGGLNAYGFAAGDPVSYSDPYGLCPCVLAIPLAIGALSTLETVAVLGVTGVLVAAHIHSGPRAIAAARSIAGSATSTQSDRRDPRPVYHRKVSAVETAQVLQSGEVWGRPPRNFIQSDIPKVQAFNGPLPPGQSGYEFVTDVEPDKGTPPWLASWSGDRWGVTTEDGFAKINVAVTKVQP
jgi:RHS repeat-associated protein